MSNNSINDMIAEYYQHILNYCITRMYPDVEHAADCTQNIVLILLRKTDSNMPREKILPWIYRVADYEVKNYKRKLKKDTPVDGAVISEMVSESPFRESVFDILKDDERELVEAYYLGEDKQKLAQSLGISLQALYTRVSRIKEKLAEELRKRHRLKP